MRLSDWSNTVLVANGREIDISIRGDFIARVRRAENTATITVENRKEDRTLILKARLVPAIGGWVLSKDGTDVKTVKFDDPDQWPLRLRVAGIMLWLAGG